MKTIEERVMKYIDSEKLISEIKRRMEAREDDLFFAPNQKVGWMNLYKRYFGLVKGGEVYNSEEAAKKIAAGDEDYITTIKIEWEEEV